MTLSEFRLGDSVRVSGKHVSGSNEILASAVKDYSISK
jgi:hypothetical protein